METLEVEITWLTIIKKYKCEPLLEMTRLKNIYAWDLKFLKPDIKFYTDPNYSSEIDIKDKLLNQFSSSGNIVRLWALITFPEACKIQISVKTNHGAAFKKFVNPRIKLILLEEALKRDNPGWKIDKLKFKNSHLKTEDKNKKIYQLLLEHENVELNIYLISYNKNRRKTRHTEASSDAFMRIEGMRDQSKIINEERKSIGEERTSDESSIGETLSEESLTDEVLSEEIIENSESNLEEIIYFEDSSATKATESDGV